jgi:hypothetical protein
MKCKKDKYGPVIAFYEINGLKTGNYGNERIGK